jgi:hypothetical protein
MTRETNPKRQPALPLTRGQRLLQLLGLLSVGEDEGVEVSRAPDLELGDGVGLARGLGLGGGGGGVLHLGLLDPGDCERNERRQRRSEERGEARRGEAWERGAMLEWAERGAQRSEMSDARYAGVRIVDERGRSRGVE